MIGTLVRSPACKWFAIPLLAGLCSYGSSWLSTPPTAVYSTWTAPATAVAPAPTVERKFRVEGGHTTTTGLLLLNDRPDFRDPATFTVVVDPRRIPSAGTDAKALIGRTITVRGRPSTYKGRPQLTADHVTID